MGFGSSLERFQSLIGFWIRGSIGKYIAWWKFDKYRVCCPMHTLAGLSVIKRNHCLLKTCNPVWLDCIKPITITLSPFCHFLLLQNAFISGFSASWILLQFKALAFLGDFAFANYLFCTRLRNIYETRQKGIWFSCNARLLRLSRWGNERLTVERWRLLCAY